MLECLILGDSIAVGTHSHRPECVTYSKIGLTAKQWNYRYLSKDLSAETVVISLGSNDYRNIKTKPELQRIREKIGTKSRVFWILPAINPDVQTIIRNIATEYGDTVIPITKTSPDRVHPTQTHYRELAEKTK